MSKVVVREKATLAVRIVTRMTGINIEAGALTRIYPADGRIREPAFIVAPISGGSSWGTIDVEPGQYIVEARLASGAIARKRVLLLSKGEQVTLEAPETTSDHFDWQVVASPQGEDLAASNVALGDGQAVTVTTVTVDEVPPDVWQQLAELAWSGRLPTSCEIERAFGATVLERDRQEDWSSGGVVFHRWTPPTPRYGFRDRDFRRTFAIVERPGVLEIASLPVPWVVKESGDVATVELAIPSDPSLSPGIVVQDPLFGSLVGYLAAGRARDASMFLEHSEPTMRLLRDAFYKKVLNPYASAAGACVLVNTSTRKQEEWDPWLGNLSKWFKWLPDGPVLQAVRQLRLGRRGNDVVRLLDRACVRGLPMCSAVAYDLFSALNVVDADKSAAFVLDRDLLVAMRAILMCLQPNQAFTVLRFEGNPQARCARH